MISHNALKRSVTTFLTLNFVLAPLSSVAGNQYQVVDHVYTKHASYYETKRHSDIGSLETQNPVLELSTYCLTDNEQHLIALDVLKKPSEYVAPSVIDDQFIDNTPVLYGNPKERQVFSQLNTTKSLFGELALAKMLANPTRSQKTIYERQEFLKGLLNADLDVQELEVLFASLRPLEADILTYWNPETDAHQQLINRLYYGKTLSALNASTFALELKTRARNLSTLVLTTWPLIPGVSREVYYKGKDVRPIDVAHVARDVVVSCNPFPVAYPHNNVPEARLLIEAGVDPRSLGDEFLALDAHAQNYIEEHRELTGEVIEINTLPEKIYLGTKKALQVALYGWFAHKACQWSEENTATTNYLHRRLINLSTYIETVKIIHSNLSDVEGSENITAYNVLTAYFNGTATLSADAQELLAKLDYHTFKGDTSFFTVTGRVLAAHTLMERAKDELALFFDAAGQLEAYFSVANAVKAHHGTRAPLCFVEFANLHKPYVKANGFWNPTLDAQSVVLNDIEINNHMDNHNVIITGPSASGKTTAVQGLALNLILAQSFGIAAARSFNFTPFTIIDGHLAGVHDPRHTERMILRTKNLKPHEFCFTALDEKHIGENISYNPDTAYLLTQELACHPNAVVVCATDDLRLTGLESTSNFNNVCVTSADLAHAYHKPYTLKIGSYHPNGHINTVVPQDDLFL